MIVDAHVHLHPDRLAEAIRRWFDTHAWAIAVPRQESTRRCASCARAAWQRMVALPYVHKPGLARALNDFTLDVAARHPEVLPCCTVFPGEEGEEEILERGALGAVPRSEDPLARDEDRAGRSAAGRRLARVGPVPQAGGDPLRSGAGAARLRRRSARRLRRRPAAARARSGIPTRWSSFRTSDSITPSSSRRCSAPIRTCTSTPPW